VQWSPAWPVYVEHSFVSWKFPLRGEDAATDGASALVLGLVGLAALGRVGTPPPSAHPAATSVPAQRNPGTTRFIVANFIAHSFGGSLLQDLEPAHPSDLGRIVQDRPRN
jgi:hypothetical protein